MKDGDISRCRELVCVCVLVNVTALLRRNTLRCFYSKRNDALLFDEGNPLFCNCALEEQSRRYRPVSSQFHQEADCAALVSRLAFSFCKSMNPIWSLFKYCFWLARLRSPCVSENSSRPVNYLLSSSFAKLRGQRIKDKRTNKWGCSRWTKEGRKKEILSTFIFWNNSISTFWDGGWIEAVEIAAVYWISVLNHFDREKHSQEKWQTQLALTCIGAVRLSLCLLTSSRPSRLPSWKPICLDISG